MSQKKTPKNAEDYYCEKCNFICCKLSDFNRHLSTRKHKMLTNVDNLPEKNATSKFICENCNKEYKHRQSLSVHRKKCTVIPKKSNSNQKDVMKNDIINDEITDTDYKKMFIEVMDKNAELQSKLVEQQEQLIELLPKTGNTTNNNNYNLNIYLNEHCKDALSLMDFVDNLKLQIKDLTLTDEKGYVEGVSNIFIKGLNELEFNKRPIHCSDAKRETLYIKNEQEWKKDDKQNSMVKDAIEKVKDDNFRQLERWQNEHPHHQDQNHPDNKIFLDLVQNCLGGLDDNSRQNNIKKVIKNIAKEVIVDGK